MTDWTSGYVSQIDYAFAYHPELNPLRTRLALLDRGLEPPALTTACELGFGQGVSLNIHAAASGARWWGVDFLPSQAAVAQSMADASSSEVHLSEQGFDEFCARTDLPDFDFIALHGVWSWISDQNRGVIVDFLRRRLRPGGVAYLSYNTLPGRSPMVPVRALMMAHAETMSPPGQPIASKIDAAFAFVEGLLAAKPLYAAADPGMADRLKSLAGRDRAYLAHEYFNRDWRPMHFAEAAALLEPAKLTYAGSAHMPDHVEAINLTAEQQGFLREIPDAAFRETVRDFMVNQQFRRDYWVKGPRRLTPLQQTEAQRAERVVLVRPRGEVVLTLTGPLGEAALLEATYGPVLEAMAGHRPMRVDEVASAVEKAGVTLPQVLQALLLLSGKGDVAAANDDAAIEAAKPRVDRLNAALMARARVGHDAGVLASPVTGGGVGVSRVDQLLLLACAEGRTAPKEAAAWVWELLSSQGQGMVRDGKTLEAAEDNLVELRAQAKSFAETRLGALQALGIV